MEMGSMILVLNGGSSTIKWALYQKNILLESGKLKNLNELKKFQSYPIDAIGHRVTFGGTTPVFLTPKTIKKLTRLIDFAPLHLPLNLAIIKKMQVLFPHLPHIGCFDTAFHRDIPLLQKLLPLDLASFKRGIYKYGFHGLSYEYILTQLKSSEKKSCIIAHLGSGSSLAAIKNGKAFDTTMSFSPTGGLMMATRTGDLDPEIVLYLLKQKKKESELRLFLNQKCGLLGMSGVSSDMEKLLKSKKKEAKVAIHLYCLIIAKQISALAASLKGVNTLIFTGGIGENAPRIRKFILEHLRFLKIPNILVVKTNEELMIAKHSLLLLRSKLD